MSIRSTLAAVDADLAAGRVPLARQRLRGLVGSYPADLAVRRRLGEVYRRYGEPVQAGRWTYLEADRDPAEVAAFEARHPDPLDRMLALGWRGPEQAAGTDVARARLAEIRAAAGEATGRAVGWEDVRALAGRAAAEQASGGSQTLGCAALVVLALLLGWLLVLGVIRLVGWF
ncbi:DUF6584 family protein [Kitasatospora sp. NPDC049258]|uniref:DUF6584 family protein n=1 Tax=Kitasatospora sp. NPDC049258 TaxID=3155394 RepID=UPI0034186EC0